MTTTTTTTTIVAILAVLSLYWVTGKINGFLVRSQVLSRAPPVRQSRKLVAINVLEGGFQMMAMARHDE
uniref:Putative secreted peptide n=1 Tax=Anopheles braziliensis TaxID=58242 RepID=A0A2M3ZQ08_9DIPT